MKSNPLDRTRTRALALLACCLAAIGAVSAGSLEPPPGPIAPTHPPETCFDNTGNRFVDCADGTLRDTVTGLYWLKDAGCLGAKDWAAANIAAAELGHGQCGLTDGSLPGDWRLPTLECSSGSQCALSDAVGELASIAAASCEGIPILNTAGTGCYGPGDPFSGIEANAYWSATSSVGDPTNAWLVFLNSGFVNEFNAKALGAWTWPVRSGR